MEINFSSWAEVQRLNQNADNTCRFADLPYFCASGGFVYCSALTELINARNSLNWFS
jgi:hypothetical protein